jgi:flagellar basal-body rod protein FlgB
MAGFDTLFGIHAAALSFQRQRMEMLASNIANADTPGYKAKDLDFSKALQSVASNGAASSTALTSTNPNHLGASGTAAGAPPAAATVYQVPDQPNADGNTVDMQREQVSFADVSLHYQASLGFIDYRLKSLMTALTGT